MNDTNVATATARSRPASFRPVGTPARENPWSGGTVDPYISLVGRRLGQGWSSSLRDDSWESLRRLAGVFPTRSTAQCSIFDHVSGSSHAELTGASVSVIDAHANLFEIRRLTGLNWTRLAELLNVDRRTIHNWVKGGQIRKVNRHHVADTLKVLRFSDRGAAELNAKSLETPSASGLTPLDLIKATQYAKARNTLGLGVSRPLAATTEPDSGFWSGTFRPMVTHDGADGSERTEPLPNEPMPKSRKRRLDRG